MKQMVFVTLLGSLIAMPNAMAEVSDEDIEQLRAQLAVMSQRLDQLAAENAELRRAQERIESAKANAKVGVAEGGAPGSPVQADAWPDRIKLDGDFRYRFESIDAEGSSTRQRHRIRARTNIKAQVAENIDVGFGLATGGNDPVSTNQTLGGGGSSKGVVLNLAYVAWEATEGLHLLAGKFKNPLARVGGQPLLWDGDWTPEGLAFKFQRDRYFVNALGTFLESDTRNSNDRFAWGSQFGAIGTIGDVKVVGGVGYYSFGAAGKSTTFGDPGNADDFFGNAAVEASGFSCGTTAGADCVFRYDYKLTELFAEASFALGNWPVTVFGDYVHNAAAADNDTGWTLGATLGQARDSGQMQFTYYYAEKEADAMLGLLTDSDFGGGGTDSRGHWLQFNYGVSKDWTIGAQYFINETNLAAGSKRDYDRLMIDMQWKWK